MLTMASSALLARQLRWRSTGFSRPRNCSGRPSQKVPNLLRLTVQPCRLPYPGGPRPAFGCRFVRDSGLRLGSTGSASTLRFSRLQSSLYATAWPFASPPEEDVYIRAFAGGVAPKPASSMTTWADNQLPRPDLHRLVMRHYGLHTPDIFILSASSSLHPKAAGTVFLGTVSDPFDASSRKTKTSPAVAPRSQPSPAVAGIGSSLPGVDAVRNSPLFRMRRASIEASRPTQVPVYSPLISLIPATADSPPGENPSAHPSLARTRF